MSFSILDFQKLVNSKNRKIKFTFHALERAERRSVPLVVFENDLFKEKPLLVIEQVSEFSHERKFDVYYLQNIGYYHRYVIVLNDEIRIITLMRVSKDLQKIVAGE